MEVHTIPKSDTVGFLGFNRLSARLERLLSAAREPAPIQSEVVSTNLLPALA